MRNPEKLLSSIKFDFYISLIRSLLFAQMEMQVSKERRKYIKHGLKSQPRQESFPLNMLRSIYMIYWLTSTLIDSTHFTFWKGMLLKWYHNYDVHLSSSLLTQMFKSFQEKNKHNAVVFQLSLEIFMSFAKLWFLRLQGQFPVPGKIS